MPNFDQAQATRLGQRGENNNTSVLMFSGEDIPEAPWPGMIIYRTDLQILQVYTGEGFEEVVSGIYGILTFVGDDIPVSLSIGDLWFNTADNRTLYRAFSIGADEIAVGEWELYDDVRIPLALETAEEAEVIAEGAAETAEDAEQTADDALAAAEASAAAAALAAQLAEAAQTAADMGLADAAEAITQALAALEEANAAQLDATQALLDAEAAEILAGAAQVAAQQAKDIAEAIEATADQALADAATAAQAAANAQTSANQANTTANAANVTANQAATDAAAAAAAAAEVEDIANDALTAANAANTASSAAQADATQALLDAAAAEQNAIAHTDEYFPVVTGDIASNAIGELNLAPLAITNKHTLTGPLIQTTALASRGIKIDSNQMIGYDAGGTPTFSLSATTGALALKGSINSGSTITGTGITGSTVTGGTVQTDAAANTGIKLTTAAFIAYNGTSPVTTISSADGKITTVGPVVTGGDITGATVTGGVLQTQVEADRGLKISSTGLAGYTNTGVATLSYTASTGAVSLTGALNSGSTITGTGITGSTVTGGIVQTNAGATTGIKLTDTAFVAYNGSTAVTTINATSGAITTTGPIVTGGSFTTPTITGGTVQTQVDANRGIKLTSSGMVGYNSGGGATFTYDSATGNVSLLGTLNAGSTINAASFVGNSLMSGVIQTNANASTGIKMTSSAFVAYGGGQPTFSIDANTGAVSMKGSLTSGSSITGASISGGTFTGGVFTGGEFRTATGNAGATVINSAGLTSYTSGSAVGITINAGLVNMRGDVTITAQGSNPGSFHCMDIYSDRDKGGISMVAALTAEGRLFKATTGTLNTPGLAVTGEINGNNAIRGTVFRQMTDQTSTSTTATAILTTDGFIRRTTSSLRYKKDVLPVQLDLAAMRALQPKQFMSRLEREAGQVFLGFIAEEAAALGLESFIDRDEQGPESFHYSTFAAVGHQALIQDLYNRIEALEAATPSP